MRRIRASLAMIAVSICIASSGCSTSQSPDPENGPVPWETQLERTLEEAERQGASAEQVEIIRSGNIDYATYESAVQKTIQCLRSSGIDVVNDGTSTENGYPEINYSYAASSDGRTEDQTDAISQQCIRSNSFFVEILYRQTPTVQEAIDNAFQPYREAAISCLRENGHEMDDYASRTDVERATGELLVNGGPDCLHEVGYRG